MGLLYGLVWVGSDRGKEQAHEELLKIRATAFGVGNCTTIQR